MRRSLRSFPFFIKECSVLCVLFHSLQKNTAFFAFFYILYKRTQRSLHSFWFHKSYKKDKSCKKKNIKEWCILFFGLKNNLKFFFAIYIYLYISIYQYIYIYISINIYFKKERGLGMSSLQKNVACFAFFYILCKRMLCSLRSFMFFAKECCILCVLLCS